MSLIGGVVGAQEGVEAGLVTGGMVASERNTAAAVAAGLGGTALGVIVGHQAGEHALTILDTYIGDSGVAFLPALGIGASVTWHNLREHAPAHTARKITGATLLVGAAFAAFEGVESGILTSSTETGLLATEAVTLASAAAVTGIFFGGVKALSSRLSPREALRATRAAALLPATYLGLKAVPELVKEPKVGGVVIAVAGTAAVASAVKSFFRPKSNRQRQTDISEQQN
jgi:hypothetical protein